MIHYQKTKLSNGLTILTAPMHETKAVAVLILVGVGSRYEQDEEAGMSHFLEHMFFKGTKKRPSYLDVSKELDGLGAHFNAYTSEENTGFFVQTSADHFAQAIDILADMLCNGSLPKKEVVKERGVITEELNMYLDIPQSYVGELAKQTLFGKNELGRPIVGRRETIASTTREKLLHYKRSHYQPSAMVVAMAGAGNPQDWLAAIERYFGNLKNQDRPTYQVFEPYQTQPQVTLGSRKTDQAHFVIALPSIARGDTRRYTVRVANNLLGGMMSSRLFDEIREKRGLAYYVNSGIDEFHETGAFFVRAGVPTAKVEEAIQVVLTELKKLKTKPVTADELKRAKENLKGRLYLELEDSFAVASFLADQQLFLQTIEQPEEIVKKVENVTTADIIELAQAILIESHLNLSVVGPYEDKTRFEKLLTTSY